MPCCGALCSEPHLEQASTEVVIGGSAVAPADEVLSPEEVAEPSPSPLAESLAEVVGAAASAKAVQAQQAAEQVGAGQAGRGLGISG